MQPRLDRHHPRLAAVQWRDLVPMRRREIAGELAISLPWLAASLAAAHHALYPVALGCSFMFFLTGLRQVHNAYHHALGLSPAATEGVMFALSILMLGSMHAVQINHLRHHRYCLTGEDVEAMSARLPAWRAILSGPLFPLRLHCKALAVGTARERRWIAAELTANVAWIFLVFTVFTTPALEYHVLAMALGQCLTSFFAVWTVHHDSRPDRYPARTVRNRIKAKLTYDMFYHVEHHLFPAVPTSRLAILAQRLDHAAPEFGAEKVF